MCKSIRNILDLLLIKDPNTSHYPIPRQYRKMNALQLALYRDKLIALGWNKDCICDCQDFWSTNSEWFGNYPDNKVGVSLNRLNPSLREKRWQISFIGTDDFSVFKLYDSYDEVLKCFHDLNKIRKNLNIEDLFNLGFQES